MDVSDRKKIEVENKRLRITAEASIELFQQLAFLKKCQELTAPASSEQERAA